MTRVIYKRDGKKNIFTWNTKGVNKSLSARKNTGRFGPEFVRSGRSDCHIGQF